MVLIEKDFSLSTNRFTMHGYHHTDATDGVKVHYIARMVEGRARFIGEDFEVEVTAGEVFYIPLGCRYHSHWYGESIVWDSFGFTCLPGGAKYPLRKLRGSVEVYELFDRIIAGGLSGCAILGLTYTLIDRLISEMPVDGTAKPSLVEEALRFMGDVPTADIPEVARFCRVSQSGLYAAFRAVGTTPVKARLKAQLDHAIALLGTTELTVDAIAERCGFNSSEYFYRVLKRETGMTSREFRRRM